VSNSNNENRPLVIFDLDGVLIDSKDIHFNALNEALVEVGDKYLITKAEHATTFDGLSTNKKLEVLHTERGLPKEKFELIWRKKQEITLRLLGNLSEDGELVAFLSYLKERKARLALKGSLTIFIYREA